MVEREWSEGFDFSTSITIEVTTASFRSTRGYTIVAALCDEIAFWPIDDSAEPDAEVLAAIRPGMSTIPNAMLLCASSPYAQRGALWDAGKDGDAVLVWQAATRAMNPTVRPTVIDQAMERDPSSAAAEYLAQFRTDVEAFMTREAVEACVEIAAFERAPMETISYSAFVDPPIDTMQGTALRRQGVASHAVGRPSGAIPASLRFSESHFLCFRLAPSLGFAMWWREKTAHRTNPSVRSRI
jgi:hypothetical protein